MSHHPVVCHRLWTTRFIYDIGTLVTKLKSWWASAVVSADVRADMMNSLTASCRMTTGRLAAGDDVDLETTSLLLDTNSR